MGGGGQRGRQPQAEPLLLCAAPSGTHERARLWAQPHPEPRTPASTGGQHRGLPGVGGLPAVGWGACTRPGTASPAPAAAGAAAFGHCTAVPVLGCSSREESYPSLANQPSSRAKRGCGGRRQLHRGRRGGGRGQQMPCPGPHPTTAPHPSPESVHGKVEEHREPPSARQRGGGSGGRAAGGGCGEEAACPGEREGIEGGRGRREEANLRPAETTPLC